MLTVRNYHYIRESFETLHPSIFGVTPADFKNQLLLSLNDGVFVKPNEIITNLEEVLKSKENYYLITFDDGLKEQFDLALPIFK